MDMNWLNIGLAWWSVAGLALDIAGVMVIVRDGLLQAQRNAQSERERLESVIKEADRSRAFEDVEALVAGIELDGLRRVPLGRWDRVGNPLTAFRASRLGALLIVLGFTLQIVGTFAVNQPLP